jgi:DNA-binding MarR family transcriptional regulator
LWIAGKSGCRFCGNPNVGFVSESRCAELDAHPHPAALAEALLIPKPSVTVYVKRLEAAEFVKREIDSADLRRHKLTLTPEGRKVMTRGLALLSEAFGKRWGRLTATQQVELKSLLEKL